MISLNGKGESNDAGLTSFVFTPVGNKNGKNGSVKVDICKSYDIYFNNTSESEVKNNYEIRFDFPDHSTDNFVITNQSKEIVNFTKMLAYLNSVDEVINLVCNPLDYFTDINSANNCLDFDFMNLVKHTYDFFGEKITDAHFDPSVKITRDANGRTLIMVTPLTLEDESPKNPRGLRGPLLINNKHNIKAIHGSHFSVECNNIYSRVVELKKKHGYISNKNIFFNFIGWLKYN